MSYTKQELIEILSPAILKRTELTPEQVRSSLEATTVAELNSMLQKQRAAGLVFQRTPQQPSSEQVQQEDLERAQHELAETEEKILVASAERDAARIIHQLRMQQAHEPQRTAQLELDRQTFADAAKVLRSFAVNEANFNVIRQTLGAGFSVYQIQQMLAANAAILSGPTHELNQWAAEDVETHNANLLRVAETDPSKLRAIVRQEAADSRAAVAQQQQADQLKAAQQRDAVMGFPPLPDTWNGQKLDSEFIRRCSAETQKLLQKRFGSAQITARLQGRG